MTKQQIGADKQVQLTLSTIAYEILVFRIKHRMSQKELAEYLGVKKSNIVSWEGSQHNFSMAELVKIFSKLGIETDIAFNGEICSRPVEEKKRGKKVKPRKVNCCII